MKILLVHPETSRTRYDFLGIIENECIDLECISAILQSANHFVTIYDFQVENESYKTIFSKDTYDAVYFTGRTMQENFMLEYCAYTKHVRPSCITMIGGLHAQLNYKRLEKDAVDYIFTGYNHFHILEVLEGKNIEEMDSICYKDASGNWIENPKKAFDIKKLPLPDRTYFYEHPNHYQYLELKHAAWVRTSFSCPYSCSFCHRNKMNAGTYSTRDIKDVVDEIAQIQTENIYLCDDDFLLDKNRVQTFVQEIKKRNIKKKYICYGRSDFIAKEIDLMEDLRDIGLYYVLVGLEDIRDDKLQKYHKLNTQNNNQRALEICNALGIHMMGMFVLGLDFEKQDFDMIYDWCKKHRLRHVAVSIFTPEMGLSSFKEYEDQLITDNPSHWDYLYLVVKPTKLSVRKYYFYYYKLLIKLFLKAKREGVYDFLDYNYFIQTFIKSLITGKRYKEDD